MKKYQRIFTIVLDSLGVGAMPDAAEYGDAGCDTLGISQRGQRISRFRTFRSWVWQIFISFRV